jgi:signal transduction histidine kinase
MYPVYSDKAFLHLRRQKFLRLYLPIILALFIALFMWLRADKHVEVDKRKSVAARVSGTVAAKLTAYTHEILGDMLFLAEQHHLFSATRETNHILAESFERLQRIRRTYLQMRFLDNQGMEVVRTNFMNGSVQRVPKEQLQHKAHRPYFKAAMKLRPGEVFISRFDLNMEHGEIEVPHQPVIRFAIPAMDVNGNHAGILVINYLGSTLLEQVALQSKAAEVELHLLNADGYWLYSPRPKDAWGFQLPNGRQITQDRPQLSTLLRQGEGELHDKNGIYSVKHIGVFDPLEHDWLKRYSPYSHLTLVTAEKPWILLSVINTGEIFASNNKRFMIAYLVFLGSVLAFWPLCLYWGGLQAKGALYRERTQQLAFHVERVREQERADVAREIHDEIGSLLTSLRYNVESYCAQYGDEIPQNKQLFQRMQEKIQSAVESMRRIINGLRPAMLDDLGLLPTIEWQLDEFEKESGITCHLDSDCNCEEMACQNPDATITAFRILQESLTNVRRHANATKVNVRMSCKAGEELFLEITDNGVGASREDLSREAHYGILGMRERAEHLGGDLKIVSNQGIGTSVKLRLPLDKPT